MLSKVTFVESIAVAYIRCLELNIVSNYLDICIEGRKFSHRVSRRLVTIKKIIKRDDYSA